MAPEIHLVLAHDEKIDIWSFGVTFYYMCTQKYPFNYNESELDFYNKIERNEYEQIRGRSPKFQELVSCML